MKRINILMHFVSSLNSISVLFSYFVDSFCSYLYSILAHELKNRRIPLGLYGHVKEIVHPK